jgi:hypothetical protein
MKISVDVPVIPEEIIDDVVSSFRFFVVNSHTSSEVL